MTNGRLVIIDSIDADDDRECSLCGKPKEGIVVQAEDGTEFNWCWACTKKLMRMRRTAKPRAEALRASHASHANGS